MSIEEQVEQWRIVFREKWAKPVNKEDEMLFNADFNSLLRKVVEEMLCMIDEQGKEWLSSHIRHQFAWLEK